MLNVVLCDAGLCPPEPSDQKTASPPWCGLKLRMIVAISGASFAQPLAMLKINGGLPEGEIDVGKGIVRRSNSRRAGTSVAAPIFTPSRNRPVGAGQAG